MMIKTIRRLGVNDIALARNAVSLVRQLIHSDCLIGSYRGTTCRSLLLCFTDWGFLVREQSFSCGEMPPPWAKPNMCQHGTVIKEQKHRSLTEGTINMLVLQRYL
jgi:hypothetical protein